MKELVSTLTGDEIQKLAGLDDVKTLKGRDNWIQAKLIVDRLFEGDEVDGYKERIDEQETFYLTDYTKHLSQVSEKQVQLPYGWFL